MLIRKTCFVSVAAMSLAFGGVTLVRAEDKMPDMGKMSEKAQDQDKEMSEFKANYTDAGFVKFASMGNMNEIKAGDAAAKMSKNNEVIEFAQHMIDDHTKVGEQMKSLAGQKGLTVHDMVDAKHKIAIAAMKKLTGSDFDKSYATAQVKDHEDTVALFKLAVEKSSDSDLKEFATKTLPSLEHHLKMARSLADKLAATADAR